jgi:hypothetical protein
MQTAVIVQRLVRFSDAIRLVVTLAKRQVAVFTNLVGIKSVACGSGWFFSAKLKWRVGTST